MVATHVGFTVTIVVTALVAAVSGQIISFAGQENSFARSVGVGVDVTATFGGGSALTGAGGYRHAAAGAVQILRSATAVPETTEASFAVIIVGTVLVAAAVIALNSWSSQTKAVGGIVFVATGTLVAAQAWGASFALITAFTASVIAVFVIALVATTVSDVIAS